MLNPSPLVFESIISLLNPFCGAEDQHTFNLKLFSEKGLIMEKLLKFKGKNHEIFINNVSFEEKDKTIWYTITGEGVGSFNIFATIFFPDLSDGTVEHAF